MARKVSFSALESRSARLRLKIRRRPYSGPSLARGIALMYRRNKTNGTWVLKASDGHGAYWTKAFGLADDFEDADAKNVLTFYQAQDQAKKLARGDDGSADSAPITVDGALTPTGRSDARSANPYNAEWPRVHLTNVLLSKPVALLTATELKKWRDGLLGTMAPSTINRLCGACAPPWNRRRSTTSEFRTGRRGKSGWPVCRMRKKHATSSSPTTRCGNSSPPPMASTPVRAADRTLAVTGARPSQAVRLRVEDLHDHPVRPKLMMPKCAKGGGRNRAKKKQERYWCRSPCNWRPN